MKSLSLALVVFALSCNAFANREAVRDLHNRLHGKSLVCRPVSHSAIEKDISGDSGHFSLSVKNDQVEISDNGGMGYGFASGEVQDVVITNSDQMFVVAGDDGSQTLQFNISNVGADASVADNCARGVLVSEPDINDLSSRIVQCCVK